MHKLVCLILAPALWATVQAGQTLDNSKSGARAAALPAPTQAVKASDAKASDAIKRAGKAETEQLPANNGRVVTGGSPCHPGADCYVERRIRQPTPAQGQVQPGLTPAQRQKVAPLPPGSKP